MHIKKHAIVVCGVVGLGIVLYMVLRSPGIPRIPRPLDPRTTAETQAIFWVDEDPTLAHAAYIDQLLAEGWVHSTLPGTPTSTTMQYYQSCPWQRADIQTTIEEFRTKISLTVRDDGCS